MSTNAELFNLVRKDHIPDRDSEIANLEWRVVEAAMRWRQAEVYEYETNLCGEREERHCNTYAALSFLRGKVMALMAAREKDNANS